MRKVKFDHPDSNGFYKVLVERIEAYFHDNHISKKANGVFWLKIVSYFILTIILYLAILSGEFRGAALALLFMMFGIVITILLFSIAHDASHHAVSHKHWVNSLFAYTWNLMGISSYFWGLKHNLAHHGFTNIPGKDDDIDQSKLVRLNPNSERKWFHRYQHLYAPFLYALLSINIVYFKDFKLLLQHSFGNKVVLRHPTREIWILILTKFVFVGYMVLIPKLVLGISWTEVLFYHILMHFAIGLFIGFILVPVHVTEESEYRLPDETGTVHRDWGSHQAEATVDFAAESNLINWITGGLNTHVIHHLFPNINHIHYLKLTKIVCQTAREFNFPYRNYSLSKVMIEHLRFLKHLGNTDNPTQNPQFDHKPEIA